MCSQIASVRRFGWNKRNACANGILFFAAVWPQVDRRRAGCISYQAMKKKPLGAGVLSMSVKNPVCVAFTRNPAFAGGGGLLSGQLDVEFFPGVPLYHSKNLVNGCFAALPDHAGADAA
jgi:hypothetical protein